MHQHRYKIGKRAKEKRAEVEARQRETRRSGSAPKRNAPNWNRVKMEVAKVKRAKLTRVKAERANVARNHFRGAGGGGGGSGKKHDLDRLVSQPMLEIIIIPITYFSTSSTLKNIRQKQNNRYIAD